MVNKQLVSVRMVLNRAREDSQSKPQVCLNREDNNSVHGVIGRVKSRLQKLKHKWKSSKIHLIHVGIDINEQERSQKKGQVSLNM